MEEPQPKCKFCGKDFTPYRPWQEFCCVEHRSLYYSRYVRSSCGEAIHLLDEKLNQVDGEGDCKKSREGGV